MFGLISLKFWKSESSKIRDSINNIREQTVSKKEIELMIKEEILKLKSEGLQVRQDSPRTPRTKMQTNLRKKANKLLDKVEIGREMRELLIKDYSTTEIYKILVDEKQLIKKTCFFKYLKQIKNSPRELREPIKRSSRTN